MTRQRILVGFAEALTAPEVLFSLKRAGFSLSAFRRSGRRAPILSALDIAATEVTPPELDFARSAEEVRHAASTVDAVFGLDDPALKVCLEAFGCAEKPIAIHATGEQGEIALNKCLQIKAAQCAGLAVPETLVAGRRQDLAWLGNMPLIAKPALATQVVDGRLIKGATHYVLDDVTAERLRTASNLVFPLLVQPLIRGVGEGVFGFATPGAVVQWSGHERLRMMDPHGSGSSACRAKMPSPELRQQVEAMIRSIGWRGPFMIELLRDDRDRAWFIELNGRMWGSMALARRNGFEYPAWAAETAFDQGFTPQRQEVSSVEEMRHLGRDILHLLFVARGPRTEFHRRDWPRWHRSLLDVVRPHSVRAFYNYDRDHPGFFLRDAWETVVSGIWRRR